MVQQPHKPPSSAKSTRSENLNNPRNFWKTTGCATVLAAAIGAGATVLGQQITKESPPKANPPEEGVTVSPAPVHQSGETSPPPGEASVRWQGQFQMTSYVNFESIPPRNGGGQLAQDVYGTLNTQGKGSRWDVATPPTKKQCSAQVETKAEREIPAEPGIQVCYKTSSDRIIYFKVLSISESSPWNEIRTYLVIWSR